MRRWFALSREERRLVLIAVPMIAASAAGLRLFGVRAMLGWADRPTGRGALTDAGVRDRALAVARAGARLPGGTCLAQSIALTRMLRKKGVPANVRIGVTADGAFAAHAWVEVDGAVVAGSSPARFAPLSLGSRH